MQAFLDGRIGFLAIAEVVERVLERSGDGASAISTTVLRLRRGGPARARRGGRSGRVTSRARRCVAPAPAGNPRGP